jgi:cell division protein FtsX
MSDQKIKSLEYKISELNSYIFSLIILFIIFLITTFTLFYYITIPIIIESRARDLGIMRYNSEKNKFIAKDSLNLNKFDIYYLQYGTLKGY